ncbi:DNA mismatch repair protein MutS2 [Lewinella marina]|uniref:Endonuclease MutS2 n=1 Tax=Neolewinella marina TaxID=438751 RepID=A0A2G0CFP5_9BACT|nr:endonuclease MutS2 [Neolewinella marina]NJB85515.1 DNA mismatch repair protein MutS2 [Neolewinella marina]PHK98796.1 endonuclease MutS2 [Neolewinella marina]
MQLLPADTLEKLEFDKVLALVERQCQGELGRASARQLTPSTDVKEINRWLDQVAEFRQGTEERNMFAITAYEDVDEELRALRVEGYALVESGLAKLNVLLLQAKQLFGFFNAGSRQSAYPQLYAVVREVEYLPELSAAIEAVIDAEGNIRSDASPELSRIRRLVGSKQREVERAFRSVIEKYRRAGYLSDTVESFRNGRRVLSVPSEHKRQIRGIIHDESATGKTAYIEPDEVISINNDIFDLQQEERREIFRILRELSATLRPYVDYMAAYRDLIGYFDLVQAKAGLARQLKAARPKVDHRPSVGIREGRHPLLYLKNKAHGRKTVPFDLKLRGKNRLLMLSGPNAGGKSIAMKSVGLLQLMVQSGMLIPVDAESEMGTFDRIFTDIGDQQSIEDDLSTYSSRLKNAREFLKAADDRTLVLIDEFGSGTDPALGGAIAEGILEGLNQRRVFGVITTHYSNLKIYAYKTAGIVNGGMNFDKDTLSPTYELNVGRPGSSYAFEIAQKSGLPQDTLAHARKRAGKNERAVDQLLVDLQREKQEVEQRLSELEQKQKTLDALTRTYEELHRDIEVRRKRLKLEAKEQSLAETAKYNKEMENLIRTLREEKKIDEAKEKARELREEREKISEQVTDLRETIYYQPKSGKAGKRNFKEGDYVKLRTGGAAGTIESIDKKRAIVIVGDLRLTTNLRDLEPADSPMPLRKERSVSSDVSAVASFSNNLDVRGMRYEEVLQTTQAFIDQALMSNASQLRIVHGKGSGALRRAVRQKLKEYNQDFSLSTPPREQGGDGVTIVDL